MFQMFWVFKHFRNTNDLRQNHFVLSSFRPASGSKHRSWSVPALAKQRSFLAAVWGTSCRKCSQTRESSDFFFFGDTQRFPAILFTGFVFLPE